MRFSAMVAGAALLVAACGGSKGGDAPKADAPSTAATTPPAAGATGNTVTIEMVQVNPTSFKFVPENVTIKTGDVVVFKGVSGLAHNVAFWSDSIPPAAVPVLTAAMKGGTGDLATEMVNDGSSVSISFAGAPAGTYKFYCIPHLAMGMKGVITIQ
jgi:plastocyanin